MAVKIESVGPECEAVRFAIGYGDWIKEKERPQFVSVLDDVRPTRDWETEQATVVPRGIFRLAFQSLV
jgi:hypothetical protein